MDRLGLGPGRLGAGRIAVAVLGFLALSHALHGAVVWLGLLEGTTLAEIDEVVREVSPAHPALVWLAVGLAPALGEELLFRGLLLRMLASRWPGAIAVLGSAALFGAAHLDPVHGAAAFLLGGYLAAVADRAGSLRPTLLCPRPQQHARRGRQRGPRARARRDRLALAGGRRARPRRRLPCRVPAHPPPSAPRPACR